MSKRTERMYKDSPHMERDKESGSMKATKKPEMQHAKENSKGMEEHEEGLPMVARHSMERSAMHARHETEHTIHDHTTPKKDKKEMHARHIKEHGDMLKRHEKELEAGGSTNKGGEKEDASFEKEGGDDLPKDKATKEQKG